MSDKHHEQTEAHGSEASSGVQQGGAPPDELTQSLPGAQPADVSAADIHPVDTPAAGVTPEPEAVPLQLPGESLGAKRQERGMSIEEVSARIKLAPRQITALEANDFAALPGMASTRGFIRSYARLLDLDPEPMLAAIADEPNPAFSPLVIRRPLPSPGFSGRRYAPPTSHRRDARRLPVFAALVLVFVGTLAFVGYRQQWLQLPPIALPFAGDITALSGIDHVVRSALPVVPAQELVTSVVPAVQPAAATAMETPVPVPPDSALRLAAREDAWVEVVAIDGERKLVSRLMKAGTTELVEITEPVILVVGNAAGIDAALRGQSLNLRAAARDNVAKLSLK
jgi:cytoskeleton protein RodZ